MTKNSFHTPDGLKNEINFTAIIDDDASNCIAFRLHIKKYSNQRFCIVQAQIILIHLKLSVIL